MTNKNTQKQRRSRRTRMRLQETKDRPRLSVFRSNNAFYAQIIDDKKAKTVVAVSTNELSDSKSTKTEKAEKVGELLAEKAKKGKVKKVMFDKGPYKYHGRVKAFAQAARKGGLEF